MQSSDIRAGATYACSDGLNRKVDHVDGDRWPRKSWED